MIHLVLLRGLPGAGKSDFAKLISEQGKYPFFSVDDYFTDSAGQYFFEFSENHKAYKYCLLKTEEALSMGFEKVIVHNTFTMMWEMEPYFKLAEQYRCKIYVLTVEHYHNQQNTHQISEEQIRKMADKYPIKLF